MTGGLDILIVGVANNNLDSIAPSERLRELFGEGDKDDASVKRYYDDFYALVGNPALKNPRLFYLAGEHMIGSQLGAGLGYVIFEGNLNDQPKKVDEAVFRRINELKQKFIDETRARGLNIPHKDVGVYALNVCDT